MISSASTHCLMSAIQPSLTLLNFKLSIGLIDCSVSVDIIYCTTWYSTRNATAFVVPFAEVELYFPSSISGLSMGSVILENNLPPHEFHINSFDPISKYSISYLFYRGQSCFGCKCSRYRRKCTRSSRMEETRDWWEKIILRQENGSVAYRTEAVASYL